MVARTGSEHVPARGQGILYFRLSRGAASSLGRGRRMGVRVVARDSSGTTATTNLTLIPFRTSGSGPHRSLGTATAVRVVGLTDFVNQRGIGGILAGCFDSLPCHPKATLSVGRTVIVTTGPEFLGANQLGYTIFRLNAAGQRLVSRASGNELGVHVALTDGTSRPAPTSRSSASASGRRL